MLLELLGIHYVERGIILAQFVNAGDKAVYPDKFGSGWPNRDINQGQDAKQKLELKEVLEECQVVKEKRETTQVPTTLAAEGREKVCGRVS